MLFIFLVFTPRDLNSSEGVKFRVDLTPKDLHNTFKCMAAFEKNGAFCCISAKMSLKK